MERSTAVKKRRGVSLAKGPTAIVGAILLAGGILGLIFGSSDWTTHAPDGDVTGSTWLGIEGNGWTFAGFAGAGLALLLGAPLHWGAKTMAMIVGVVMAAACVIAIVDGNDVFGVAAFNRVTMVICGIAAVALLVIAMLPRVGRRRDTVVEEDDTTAARNGRFRRRREPVNEPVGTPERRA